MAEDDAKWERLAHQLVVENLYDAAFRLDTRSEIGRRAHERLLGIANGVDPREVRRIIAERDTMSVNFAKVMKSIIGSGSYRQGTLCAKHQREVDAIRRKKKSK